MSSSVRRFAQRVESDPFFLGCILAPYARAEDIGPSQFAERLECSPETFDLLCLCRRPRPEPALFQVDVAEISGHFHVREDVLIDAVRLADALVGLGHADSAHGLLMAARDREAGSKSSPDQQ